MSEDWDFYPLRVDNQRASIFVDLGIRSQAPLKSHPTAAYLRIRMVRPREDGVSSQEEFDDLITLENEVRAKVVRDGTCLFVGRSTSNGNRDFFFYTNDSGRFEISAREAMRNFPAYQYEMGAREDRDWTTYFGFLYPSQRSMQLIINRRVRDQLERDGDNTNNERQIDHLVLLPSLEAQSAFARDVVGEGFSLDRAPSKPNDDGQFSVEFSRADRPAQIDDVVLSLLDRATNLGGIYDGWGCHITP